MMDDQLNPLESISIVARYFDRHFNSFSLIKKTNYTGYWLIEYRDNTTGITIVFDGDIGGHFSVKIFIDKTDYSLWQFDRSVINATKSTQSNLLYQLDAIKKFLTNR